MMTIELGNREYQKIFTHEGRLFLCYTVNSTTYAAELDSTTGKAVKEVCYGSFADPKWRQDNDYLWGVAHPCLVGGELCFRHGRTVFRWKDNTVVHVHRRQPKWNDREDRNRWKDEVHGNSVGESGNYKRVRATDTHVVMTGSEALIQLPILIGPTKAAEAIKKPGSVKTKHLFIYGRFSGLRVMRLDSNPIHLILLNEDNVVAAVSRQRIYLIDLD